MQFTTSGNRALDRDHRVWLQSLQVPSSSQRGHWRTTHWHAPFSTGITLPMSSVGLPVIAIFCRYLIYACKKNIPIYLGGHLSIEYARKTKKRYHPAYLTSLPTVMDAMTFFTASFFFSFLSLFSSALSSNISPENNKHTEQVLYDGFSAADEENVLSKWQRWNKGFCVCYFNFLFFY